MTVKGIEQALPGERRRRDEGFRPWLKGGIERPHDLDVGVGRVLVAPAGHLLRCQENEVVASRRPERARLRPDLHPVAELDRFLVPFGYGAFDALAERFDIGQVHFAGLLVLGDDENLRHVARRF
jgi:hypothetical protein